MRMKALTSLVVSLAFLTVPVVTHAQFTVYTTLASFLAATSASGTDTYTGFDVRFVTPSPIVRTSGPYSYTATAARGFFGVGTISNPALSTNIATDAIVFNAFTSGVRGIGGNFFGSNGLGSFQPADITVSATNAGGTTTQVLALPATTSFLGFVSTGGAISTFSVAAIQANGLSLYPSVDNFVLALAPENVVPEPSTYALMMTGLVGVVIATRRRRLNS